MDKSLRILHLEDDPDFADLVRALLTQDGLKAEVKRVGDRSAFDLAQKVKIETPIIAQIYAALYEGKSPAQALQDLTARESRPEN